MSTAVWTAVLAVSAATLLLLLAAAIRALGSLKSRTKHLLLGLPNSGKTTLFLRLSGVRSESLASHTSMVPNLSPSLVDSPGHHRVRSVWETFLPETRGVVFVVGAAEFESEAPQVAEFLYRVLDHPEVRGRRTPVMVFCNKCDLVVSASVESVKARLAQELEQLRSAAVLNNTPTSVCSPGPAVSNPPGQRGSRTKVRRGLRPEDSFQWERASTDVTFSSGSALCGQIDPVSEFVHRLK